MLLVLKKLVVLYGGLSQTMTAEIILGICECLCLYVARKDCPSVIKVKDFEMRSFWIIWAGLTQSQGSLKVENFPN